MMRIRSVQALCLAFGLGAAACGPTTPDPATPNSSDPPLIDSSTPQAGPKPNADLDQGVALVKAEKFDQAIAPLEKALATDPKNGDAAFYLGLCYEQVKRKPDAEAKYKLALQNDPKLVEASQNLAALYLDDPPRPDQAIAVLESALKIESDNSRLLQNLGFAYGLKGDVDKASKAYTAALAKEDTAALHFAFGSMLFDAKKLPEAVAELNKAAAGITDVPTLATMARMMGAAKSFDGCVKLLDKAIAAKGDAAEFWVRRGTCKHELKDETGAGGDFRGALKIDPKFAPAHYYLGMSLLAQKKNKEAKAELKKAYDLDKDSGIGKLAKQKLDELH